MNDHPDLMALLRGELPHGDVTEVADHLDHCEECRRDLAETGVGHALLTGRYPVVDDVSLERNDGNRGQSVTSVLQAK